MRLMGTGPEEGAAGALAGGAGAGGGGEDLVVGAGESLVIPPNVPHGVVALEDTVVTDVFTPRRDDWIKGDDAYLRR